MSRVYFASASVRAERSYLQKMGRGDHFYYQEEMMGYDFGPGHPLKPIRLKMTMDLLRAWMPELEFKTCPLASEHDVRRVHTEEYIRAVQALSDGNPIPQSPARYGFGNLDNPPFRGMYEASLLYTGGAVQAAEGVILTGEVGFNMAGGLHHARAGQASGFCVFNDPAISAHILKEKYKKVAYIDIDLHHGDGVQWLFFDDPDVLTYSIHQDGSTLYPGTGFVDERGEGGASVNVPLPPMTTGEVWLRAFRETVMPAMDWFQPQAIVLQMGCDPHIDDPLGRLQVRTEDWLAAVKVMSDLNLPIVACGGGGYCLANVPRMWAGAVLTLLGQEVPEKIPEDLVEELGVESTFDRIEQPLIGTQAADELIDYWKSELRV